MRMRYVKRTLSVTVTAVTCEVVHENMSS